ncbi:MAG: helix-turn-helix transcriptional regulator [Bacteroidetes bacterium]|nr:helix-turn-helix transcriptional regulator [Bacteroidota bacterium]
MKKTEENYYYKQIILRNIKKLRLISGMSEEFISSKLEISQGFYSKIEAGKINNLNSYWSQIAKILAVPPLVLALPDCFSIIFEDESAEVKVRKKKVNENEILEKYYNLLKEKDLARKKHIRRLRNRIKILNKEINSLKNINNFYEFEMKNLKTNIDDKN